MSGFLWWLFTKVLRYRPRQDYVVGVDPARGEDRIVVKFEIHGLDLVRKAVERAEQEAQRAAVRLQVPDHQFDPHVCRDLALDLWEIEQLPEVEQ